MYLIFLQELASSTYLPTTFYSPTTRTDSDHEEDVEEGIVNLIEGLIDLIDSEEAVETIEDVVNQEVIFP